MGVRRLRPEEQIIGSKIEAIAFASQRDFSAAEREPERFQEDYELGRGYFDASGKLCACLYVIPFKYRFDGHTVEMGGIAGVATLPEERSKGYPGELLRYALQEMHENGQPFSYLHPISIPFYRRFGYECCYEEASLTIPISAFRHFRRHGEVELCLPGQDRGAIEALYNRFIADKNLALVRDERRWSRLLGKDPYLTRQYTYVWRDAAGEPRGYLVFEAVTGGEPEMNVWELIWLDYEALEGIFGFIHRLATVYKTVRWRTPHTLNLHPFFPEPRDIRSAVSPAGMNRIVDVARALALASYPGESGRLTLQVRDAFLEWNDGTFVVSWGPGGATVSREQRPPDLTCSIEVLAQLLTGYTTIDDYLGRPDVKVHRQHALLSAVFRHKKLFVNDHF